MEAIKTTVSGRIAKPVATVFDAVVNASQIKEYFATGGASGPLEAGKTVTWGWHDFPEHKAEVRVREVVPNSRIVMGWESADDAPEGETYVKRDTTITMTFEQLDDGRTLVTVTEEGWRPTPKGINAALGNTSGWSGMLAGLRLWLEHGIRFRHGYYK